MRAHLYFYKLMSLFKTHLSCSQAARVHAKSLFGQDPIGNTHNLMQGAINYYVLHLYQVVIVTLNYGKSVEVRETRMT